MIFILKLIIEILMQIVLFYKTIQYICTVKQNGMNIVSHKRLADCYHIHPDAELGLQLWYKIANEAKWKCFADIKKDFNSVDSIGNQRYVFNIKGNNYRLVVVIQFVHQYIYIRFAGTHAQYDKIDCNTI